mgnify:CR=1 FL=1
MSFSQWPVTEELKEYIINGFNIIKKSNDNYKQKSAVLNQLLSLGAGAGWRPKAITIGALKLFVANNFKKPKGLERAHEFHRRDTIKILIEKKWEKDEWWQWFYNRDFTILSTRSENRDEKNFTKVKKFPIPIELKLFSGKRVGFVYDKEEKLFLQDLTKEISL